MLNRRSRLVIAGSLALACVSAPAVAATTDPSTVPTDTVEPVVINLTDGDGDRTDIATGGLAAPSASAPFATARVMSALAGADDAVLTRPIPAEEFLVAGVTWDAGQVLADGAEIYVRVSEDGTWSSWQQAEHEEGAESGEATAGTDPFITGGAQIIQVRVTGPADQLPDNLAISLLSADELEAPVIQEPQGISTLTTVRAAQPTITSRAGWGADETKMRWQPTNRALKGVVVHHTAGTNNYTQAQSASVVRGIYQYHAVSRGWGDIGYNFLVDKWGRVFEGRSGSLRAPDGYMVQGAHAAPVNTGTIGISAMGDYTQTGVPATVMSTMTNVIAWQFERAGIDARTRSGIIAPGTAATAKGTNLPRIIGHMDVSATACPGRDIYGQLPAMINNVANMIGQVPAKPKPAPVKPAPVTPAPTKPAPAPSTGLHSFFLNNAFTTKADITFDFGPSSSDVYAGDWNGNGTDTIATRTKQIFDVKNSHKGGYPDRVFAYGKPGDTVLVGDWDGDKEDTLAVRRGNAYYVRNSVTTGPADKVVHYGKPGDEILVGDWNGDGKDTFAVRRGAFIHIKNSMTNGSADRVVAYGKPSDTMLVGDWNGDGKDTFAVRRSAQYLIRNSMTTGPADTSVVFGRGGDKVLVGDWNADRKDTLGVVRN